MHKYTVWFWFPRLASIAFILFVMMFSLDVFEADASPTEIAIGLLMHNLPAFAMMIITWLAWKQDLIGAVGFGVVAVVLSAMIFQAMPPMGTAIPNLVITGPALLVAIFYLINWFLVKRNG